MTRCVSVNVTRNDHLASVLLDEMMEGIAEDRTNMHPSVSDLIGCLTKSYYDTEPDNKLGLNDKTKLYFLIGLGLERVLLIDRKKEPIYGETEGIHWHVDSIDEGLLELKSTRASPAKGPDGFSARWLNQIKGYLSANGIREVDLAIVHLVQPEFVVWHLSFDQWELDMHWDWLKSRRDVWNEAKATKTPPKAFAWNEEWECKECAYKLICTLNKDLGR